MEQYLVGFIVRLKCRASLGRMKTISYRSNHSDASVEDLEGLLGADERFLCSLLVKSRPRLASFLGLQRGRAAK